MFKEANNCFTHREIQLLKFKVFEKTTYINAFIISNVHIFLSEEEKSDNEQEKVIIFEQNFRFCKTHFKISLSELKDTQIAVLR